VSSVVYLLCCRSLDIEAEWAAAARADQGLDAPPLGAPATPA